MQVRKMREVVHAVENHPVEKIIQEMNKFEQHSRSNSGQFYYNTCVLITFKL